MRVRSIAQPAGAAAFRARQGAISARCRSSRMYRHVTVGGLPSSTSAIRKRVPGVVPSGSAAGSKKPQATISRFGSGSRS